MIGPKLVGQLERVGVVILVHVFVPTMPIGARGIQRHVPMDMHVKVSMLIGLDMADKATIDPDIDANLGVIVNVQHVKDPLRFCAFLSSG